MKGPFKFLDTWYENTKALAFPIPVDIMVIPMVQAAPQKWWKIAGLASIFSVLGGIFGYFIGLMFFETIALPLLEMLGKTRCCGSCPFIRRSS